jgi:hypothetical protein
MNIGKEINEDVYYLVWENILRECRKPIIDQISSLAHVNTYDSLKVVIDDALRGNISMEVVIAMGDKIPKKIRKFPKIS